MVTMIYIFRSYYGFMVLSNKFCNKLMQQSAVSLLNESWLRLAGL